MNEGHAPLGPDDQPIRLHHMLQQEPGPLAEITTTFDRRWGQVINWNPPTWPSGINRRAFDKVREDYWKWRGQEFMGHQVTLF
jgi:hypothetical protein